MGGEFVTFFDSLKDPLLMFLALGVAASIRWGFIERKERLHVQKEKDDNFKETVELGKDVVRLTTIWETKAQNELNRADSIEKENAERYTQIINLLGNISGKLDNTSKK